MRNLCILGFGLAVFGCAPPAPDLDTLVVPPKTGIDLLKMAHALAIHGDLRDKNYVEKMLKTSFTTTEGYRDFDDGRRVIGAYDFEPAQDFWYPNPYPSGLYRVTVGGVWNSGSGKCLPGTSPGTCYAGFSAGIAFNAVRKYRPDLCITGEMVKQELGNPDFENLTPHGGIDYEYDYWSSGSVSGISVDGFDTDKDATDKSCGFSLYIFERQRETVNPKKPASYS